MLRRLARLCTIRSRLDAYAVIYAIAVGACERGSAYLTQYPGWGGRLLFLACCGTVMMAGAKILDCVRIETAQGTASPPSGESVPEA